MDETQATAIADALGGDPWQSGGDIWVVVLRRADQRLVVISDDVVCLYETDEAFEDSKATTSIPLR